jgi:hypothetical protein
MKKKTIAKIIKKAWVHNVPSSVKVGSSYSPNSKGKNGNKRNI